MRLLPNFQESLFLILINKVKYIIPRRWFLRFKKNWIMQIFWRTPSLLSVFNFYAIIFFGDIWNRAPIYPRAPIYTVFLGALIWKTASLPRQLGILGRFQRKHSTSCAKHFPWYPMFNNWIYCFEVSIGVS